MTESVRRKSCDQLQTHVDAPKPSNNEDDDLVFEDDVVAGDDRSLQVKLKFSELRVVIISVVAAFFFILLLYLAVTMSVIILRAHNHQHSNQSIEENYSNEP